MSAHPSPNPTPAAEALAEGLEALLWVCLVGVIAAVLVINPEAYDDAYFSPKWAWLASMASIAAAALLGRALLGRPILFPLNPIWIAAILFLLLHLVSALWAPSPSLALERTRHLLWLTAGLGLGVQIVRTRRALLWLGWLWLTMAVVVALWTLGQDFQRAWWPDRLGITSNLPDWRGYLAASLGNSNHVGDLTALGLLLSLVFLGEARKRLALVASMAAAVVLAAALTVAYSVGSNLGLFIGAALMLGLTLRREGVRFFRRRRRWALLALLWAAMLAFFLLDHPANPHRPGLLRQGFGSDRWREGGPTRLVIWAGGLEMVRKHPWLGVGAGNFTFVYPEMKSALLEGHPDLLRYQGLWTNAAHNSALQSWSELGIGGLVLFALLGALAFHSLLGALRWAPRMEFLMRMTLAGLLAAWFGQAMMNFSLQQPSGAITLYLLLGSTIAERAARRRGPPMPSLLWQTGFVRLRVDWLSMSRPTALGLAFSVRAGIAALGALALLLAAVAVLPLLRRPLEAQKAYARARSARTAGLPDEEEKHLLRALEIDPRATGCRSRYSELLVELNRPAEALEQLRLVRLRLNSSELYEREARAHLALGQSEQADRAWAEYVGRVWAVRNGSQEPDPLNPADRSP